MAINPTLILIIIILILSSIWLYSIITKNVVNLTAWNGLSSFDEKLLTYITKHPNFTTTYIPFVANIFFNNTSLSSSLSIPAIWGNRTILRLPDEDLVGNKKTLWKTLYNYYGHKISKQIMPDTYVFPDNIEEFQNDTNRNNNKWVLKKNTQRQEGIFISKSKPNTNFIEKERIIVAQVYIEDIVLYKFHKVNFRLYMTVDFYKDNIQVYLSNDGIVSYSAKKYQNNENSDNINSDSMITSFYDSEELYKDGFPVTIQEYINETNNQGILGKMKDVTIKIKEPLYRALMRTDYDRNTRYTQIFGVDYLEKQNGEMLILEVNTGPNMKQMTERDAIMREKIMMKYLSLL